VSKYFFHLCVSVSVLADEKVKFISSLVALSFFCRGQFVMFFWGNRRM
jgi:hypothetical protein